jgi:hypothetical protein
VLWSKVSFSITGMSRGETVLLKFLGEEDKEDEEEDL